MDALEITLEPRKGQPVQTKWNAQAYYEPPYLSGRPTRIDIQGLAQFGVGADLPPLFVDLPPLFVDVRLDPSTPVSLRGVPLGDVRLDGFAKGYLRFIVRGTGAPTPGEDLFLRQNVLPAVKQWIADKLPELEKEALAAFKSALDAQFAEVKDKLAEAREFADNTLLRFRLRLEKERAS